MVRHLRWALLWAALIFVLCLMPGQAIPSWDWADLLNVDKLVHAALFAVLFLLLERGLRRFHAVEGKPAKVVLTAIVASVAYGGLMELMQQLPALGRRGDVNDLIANSVGVILGWGYFRSRNGDRRTRLERKDA